MNDRLREAIHYYSKLAVCSDNPSVRAGRPANSEDIEAAIWQDIRDRLRLRPGLQILDIGVGNGFIAKQWAEMAITLDLSLTFVDFDPVLQRLQADIQSSQPNAMSRIQFASGSFPFSFDPDFLLQAKFDRIVLYSVIHYTNEPRLLIDAAAGMLRPGGRLLIGDVPNLDKKGRFLATESGRRFDAVYKKVSPDSLPHYADYREFTKQALAAGAPPLDDTFVLDVVTFYRQEGFQAYVLEQPDNLSLNFTREDILLCAPDE